MPRSFRMVIRGFSTLLLDIYRLAQECSGTEFQNKALEKIKLLVPFDRAMWGTATMTDSGIDIHTLNLHKTLPGMIEAYERIKQYDSPAAEVARYPKATMCWNISDIEEAELREFMDRFEHRNLLITSTIDANTRFATWLSLYRMDANHVFSGIELAFVDELAEHLMQALAINRVVRMEQIANDISRERWSVAIADRKGVIYHADIAFKDLIKKEFNTHSFLHLPDEINAQLHKNRFEVVGKRTFWQGQFEDDLFILKARDKHQIDTLSAKEFKVAQLISDGLTLKQVSEGLNRSPETIRTQLRIVFKKLGINKVTQLPSLLSLRSVNVDAGES